MFLESNINYNKKNNQRKWDKKFKLLEEYINSSEEIKGEFEQTGTINQCTVVEKNGERINLGTWLNTQRMGLMSKYKNYTIEQIQKDEDISEDNKYRMIKLLTLGVKYPKEKEEINKSLYLNWQEKYKLLEEYINSSEKIKNGFEIIGRISYSAQLEKNGKVIQIGDWLNNEINRLEKVCSQKSIEKIRIDKEISETDKYKAEKFFELGVCYPYSEKANKKMEDNNQREIIKTMNEEIYKRKWDEKIKILKEYINSSEEVKTRFNETGYIDRNAIYEKNGKVINIGIWVATQKNTLMKKYSGKTKEQIEQDEQIPELEKYKIIKLLEAGISYYKYTVDEKKDVAQNNWDKNFEVLKKYINSSEEIKEKFKQTGSIDSNAFIWEDDNIINLGSWLIAQKQTLMKKYDGMSIEQIKNDKNISKHDKYKMIKLLELGVSYSKNRQEIAEERAKKNLENWKEKFNIFKKYVSSSKRINENFKQTGEISINAIIQSDNEQIMIGNWLYRQKTGLMKKYNGMTIDEIKKDKNIPEHDRYKMIELLGFGVSYPTVKAQKIGKSSFDANIEQCDDADCVIKKLKNKERSKINE